MTGKLIAIDGIDGAGKTTQAGLLSQFLRICSPEIVETHEPTRGKFGQLIRSTSARGQTVDPAKELAWFMEDRREHVSDVIAPALSAGKIVVTDRYYLSTVAYQGARGLGFERILAENEDLFPTPDLAIVLRVAPTLGLERIDARGQGVNPVFERADFLKEVADIFDAIQRDYVVRVDGSLPIVEVQGEIERAVKKCIL